MDVSRATECVTPSHPESCRTSSSGNVLRSPNELGRYSSVRDRSMASRNDEGSAAHTAAAFPTMRSTGTKLAGSPAMRSSTPAS